MPTPDQAQELIRRWREFVASGERLVAELEALSGSRAPHAVPAPVVAQQVADPEGEEAGEEDPLARYRPPREMKPHEYVFWVVQTFQFVDFGPVCEVLYEDGDTPANRKRVRNILSHLRDAGRINNWGHNVWKVRAVGERKR